MCVRLFLSYYTGEADCVDHLEGCSFGVEWVAHPFQNVYHVNSQNYAFKVRPVKEDSFFGPNFTLNRSFDEMIEHYVMHGILSFNPDLSILGAESID
ncbi:hypothetical protein J4443_00475 [Candidatus Woesearchaeota archaeon]|nr:hypothetical protein [Candidatus Woesearchaeota archaeon]